MIRDSSANIRPSYNSYGFDEEAVKSANINSRYLVKKNWMSVTFALSGDPPKRIASNILKDIVFGLSVMVQNLLILMQ